MTQRFAVRLSWDFVGPNGERVWGDDLGMGPLDVEPDLVEWSILQGSGREIGPEHIADCDGLVLLTSRVTERTFERGAERLTIVGRHGVGYDSVNVAACTAHDVALFITPESSRHPVAAAAVTFILALSRRVLEKDQLVRAGRWADRQGYVGHEIQRKTLGIIGLGNIGREVVRLLAPFEMRVLAHDPFLAPDRVPAGVELVPLETLLRESDYVSIHCLLTPETHHLIGDAALSMMKPTAHLINLARGPIVDQVALTAALSSRQIAGAALDVFDPEPIRPDDPLLALDNVICDTITAHRRRVDRGIS